MSFFLGLATGASEQYVKEVDKTREKIERQRREAKAYAAEAKKREQEAAAVRTKIRNASGSYGISEQTLFSAYSNGHLEQYLDLIDRATSETARRGGSISPDILEGFYNVPQHVADNPTDIDTEINRAFGLINQNIEDPEIETNDNSLGASLGVLLGLDAEGALRRQTVGGYNYEDLMNMPTPSMISGDGGNIDPSIYGSAYPYSEPEGPGGKPLQQWQVSAVSDAVTGTILSMIPNEKLAQSIAAQAQRSVVAYITNNNITQATYGNLINNPEQFVQEFMREDENGVTYLWDGTMVDGERQYYPVNLETSQIEMHSPKTESELLGTPPSRPEEGPVVENDSSDVDPARPSLVAPEQTEFTAVEAQKAGVEPGILDANNNEWYFVRMNEDGNPIYRNLEGTEMRVFNIEDVRVD